MISAEAVDRLGARASRKLQNNTYLERCQEHGGVCVRLHATHIITFRPDGAITLRSGGWRTPTTKDRLTTYGPVRVSQVRGVWSFEYAGRPYLFEDEVTLYPDGIVSGAGSTPARAQHALRRRVQRYAADFVAALDAGQVPAPGPGDCFYCQGLVTDLASGQPTLAPDHLLSHLEERYFVPTLLARAVAAGRCAPVAHGWLADKLGSTPLAREAAHMGLMRRLGGGYETIAREQVTKALRRYLLRALGQAA